MLSCRNPPRGCASGSRAACQSAIALSPCLTARRHPTQLPPLILRTNCAVHQALCPRRHIAAASTSGTAAAGGGDGEQDAAAAATPSPATTAAAASSSSREGEREGHPAQHFRAVPEPEVEPKTLFGKLSFSDVSYYINVLYWSLLLVSVVSGSEVLAALTHFEHYTTAMFALCSSFMIFHMVRFVRDVARHLQRDAHTDWREVLRFAWLSVFWAGFVLWYAAPPVARVAELAGTAGAIASIFGLGLSLAAALQIGMWSLMGEPQVPRRLSTTGVFALLRHPQALGNILFLVGFSLAGGALWAAVAFAASFVLYSQTVVPREERLLTEAFGDKYKHYRERVPRYSWALVLLIILEVFLLWKCQPWATPIDATPPPGSKLT